jgi:hypothetical protein
MPFDITKFLSLSDASLECLVTSWTQTEADDLPNFDGLASSDRVATTVSHPSIPPSDIPPREILPNNDDNNNSPLVVDAKTNSLTSPKLLSVSPPSTSTMSVLPLDECFALDAKGKISKIPIPGPHQTTRYSTGGSLASLDFVSWNVIPKFHLLQRPGLQLTNYSNNCWYHATMQLLAAIPPFTLTLRSTEFKSPLAIGFKQAILAIGDGKTTTPVSQFYELVKDFYGVRNRYRQAAAPDFLEYLVLHLPDVFNSFRAEIPSQLQCLRCKWISVSTSQDFLSKLYIPTGLRKISLSDLFDYNFRTITDDATYCGKCQIKTSQKVTRDYFPDLLCFEIIRIRDNSSTGIGRWIKNNLPITFSTDGIKLPGSDKLYDVIASSHHKGSLNHGHWITKFRTEDSVWWEADDLRLKVIRTAPPGCHDHSVSILVLLAKNRFYS